MHRCVFVMCLCTHVYRCVYVCENRVHRTANFARILSFFTILPIICIHSAVYRVFCSVFWSFFCRTLHFIQWHIPKYFHFLYLFPKYPVLIHVSELLSRSCPALVEETSALNSKHPSTKFELSRHNVIRNWKLRTNIRRSFAIMTYVHKSTEYNINTSYFCINLYNLLKKIKFNKYYMRSFSTLNKYNWWIYRLIMHI